MQANTKIVAKVDGEGTFLQFAKEYSSNCYAGKCSSMVIDEHIRKNPVNKFYCIRIKKRR